ncbi:MAG: hypothetical protein IKG81_06215 [Bacteroidales bacterium]|nr:hypothetical protein [Bacteroidales bacterium]
MKNSSTTLCNTLARLRWLVAGILFVLMLGSYAQAQVSIPGTKVKFTFPSKWKYLKSEKVDANTQMYLYYYTDKVVASHGDTTLPFLRIFVRKNYTDPIYDFVFERYNKEPYQSLSDYTKGLGLPKSGGMGYIGAYTNVKDKKDYQFRMVYFQSQNTMVEFRLETTRATYSMMEKEFDAILKSLKF